MWYKNAIFYEVYVRAFFDSNADGHGDLPGLIQKLNYIQALGVDCLWLLPIYPSPLQDDGYDIADYYNVLNTYGDLNDLQALIREAHDRGIRIILDLVLNHTSDQHPWFQSARRDRNSKYRDYYVWSDTNQKYQDARIIFLDTEISNWSYDEVAGQYYWHRFYASQPDLNYDNPAVQDEMFEIIRHWLNLGIDGFRADAVPYLFEREETNCENLAETHSYLKKLRKFIDDKYPGRILLCEANQWPADVRPYFGDADEFQMGFHFPVMPRIFLSLRKADRQPLQWILDQTPKIPDDCQWCVFLRNHDELTLEMVTEEERHWMWQEYAPNMSMRLNLGIRRRLAPLLDNDRRKIELANSLLFSLPGSPILYYGDEIGMGDNINLPDRNGVRTPMQWDSSPGAGFSSAALEQFYTPVVSDESFGSHQVNVTAQINDPNSLWYTIQRMIHVRKANPVFGSSNLQWVEVENRGLAIYWREDQKQRVLVIQNLAPRINSLQMRCQYRDIERMVSLFDDSLIYEMNDGQLILSLEPYGYLWLMPVNAGD